MDILHLFCDIDDFCQLFEPFWTHLQLSSGEQKRNRTSSLALSEVMTLVVLFHASAYRNFKSFYMEQVMKHLVAEFPHLVSYNRFVELMSESMVPLCCYLQSRFGDCSGISFIDSTSLKVCHNRRIDSNKVFQETARRGRTSVDWFYGFKLHMVINDKGELLCIRITAGNVDDRRPVPILTKELFGKLFGDKGYISQALFESLFLRDSDDGGEPLQLITKLRKGMRNRLMPIFEKIMLRKRSIIESVIDQLKNISQIEHTRHRSHINFFVNLIAGLIAYTWREKKPSLDINLKELYLPPVVAF